MRLKTIIIFAFLSITSVSNSAHAQSEYEYLEVARTILKQEKKDAISQVMDLSDAEKDPFWQLYKEYTDLQYKIGDEEMKLINEYAKSYETLSNEKADELMKAAQRNQWKYLKLQKKYYKKFKKILPAGKAARFIQAENKINALIDAQISLEIPIIEVK